jgi:hypothetical protein
MAVGFGGPIMGRVEVMSKVGSDGVLRLAVPLPADAGRDVKVTVEPVPPPMTQEEWQAFIRQTAGSITDPEFRRWEQGEPEERDPLS